MRTPCANAAHESGSRETSTLKRKITHKLKILHRGKPHATRYIVDFTSTSRGKAPLASQQTHTCPYLGIVEKRPWKIPRTSPRRCSSSGDHHELCLDFSWGRRQWPQASRIRRPWRGVWGGVEEIRAVDEGLREYRGAGAGGWVGAQRRHAAAGEIGVFTKGR